MSEFPASAGNFVVRRGGLRILCSCAMLWFAGTVVAQKPQFSLGSSAADSIPQTTVVPVQPPAVQIVEHTTVYEDASGNMTRAERRAYRAKLFAQHIDSLVQSRDYMFFPNSMQSRPEGMIRSVYANYYYFGLFVDQVEVHLPAEWGVSQWALNFDATSLREYKAEHLKWGWTVVLDFTDGEKDYRAEMIVSTVTGETILTLTAPDVTMRYVGWLWDKKTRRTR